MVMAIICMSVYMVHAEEAAPRAVSCPSCNGGGLIESVGPIHAKYLYESPCGAHPGYMYVTEAKVRMHSFRCNRCSYTESYEETLVIYFAYCKSGQSHAGINQ